MNGTEAEASYLLLFRSPTKSVRNFLFACDVKAAMLVVKNESISLPWEINFIFIFL